jgi:hypothetical protein
MMLKIAASTIEGPLYVKVGTYDDSDLLKMTVPDLAEAARVCRTMIEEGAHGARDWRGGEVVSEESGLCVAVVSYNGRTWFPGMRNPEGDALAGELEYDLDA